MKKYLLIYKEFFKTSLSEALSFRFNFVLQFFMNICFIGAFFFNSIFIFQHVDLIGLWNKEEFLFFLSFVLFLNQTHFFLIADNYWYFSENIKIGNFDFTLLKPISSLFITFFSRLMISNFSTVLISFCMLIYFGLQLDLSLAVWLSLPFCFFLSIALLCGIEIIVSLLNFFTIEGMGINQIRIQIQQVSRWPDFIYQKQLRFFLIPFLAISSIPVRWILNTSYWSWLLIMVVSTFTLWFCIIVWLWPKGLRWYESASS